MKESYRFNMSACHSGDIGESLLLAELVLRGLNVSIPFGHDCLYDLVVQHSKGKLLKVQIKNRTNLKGNMIRIFNLDRYINNIDVLAVLVESDWYFVSNRALVKYQGKSNLSVKELGLKNNFKIFGVIL
jgi:hypothetical protein